MMINDLGKSNKIKFILIFLLLSVLTIIFLTGCGGSENFPSAGVLVSGEVTLTWKDV
jgi:hypothetical protein